MNNFTIIIPIFNESESIFRLLDEISYEFQKKLPEILIVDDGSNDDFQQKSANLKKRKFKIFTHTKNLGKSKAMETGIKNAGNDLICVMDGDGQNPPYEVKKLINHWKKTPKNNFTLICGNRTSRKDTFIKRLSSKLANKIRRLILDDDCNDTACALKVFSKSDYLKIPYLKNMHRFLPALFKMRNGAIYNIAIDDRERFAGISKFNFNNRFWVGILDLIKVWILIKKKRSYL